MDTRRFFSSPVFPDEEQTRRAGVLHVVLWSSLLITLVAFAPFMLVLPQNHARWITVELVAIFTYPVLMLLNRRGHTRMASMALLAVIGLLAMALALTAGGVHSPTCLGYVVVFVVIVGLLFGEKAGVIAAIVVSLTGLAFVGLEATGHLPANRVAHTALSLWITQALYLCFIAGFQFLANRSIKDAWERGRRELDERRQIETALRESEDRYRIVVEQTGQMVYEYDAPTGRISWRGAIPELTGFTVEEFQRVDVKTWEEMIHPDDRPGAMRAFHEAMQVAGIYDAQYRFRCKDGSYIYIEDNGLFLPDASGKTFRMLGSMADITAYKEAEKALRQSRDEQEARVRERTAELQKVNKDLEAFTYSVSHDLRAPLRTVEGFTDLLTAEYARQLPEDARQLLTGIKDGAQRMGQLIQSLLNLSHINRQSMMERRVNVTTLVREVFEELRGQQPGRDIELRMDELPDCMGDPSLLRQVFVNLLSNAIKFTGTRAKAVIEMGFQTEAGNGVYFVRDNGVGFDMRYVGKLFGVFQRLHRAEQFAGTGVGLSIVQRIISRHGGRIWAESAVDQGTTFYFTLPPCKNHDGDERKDP